MSKYANSMDLFMEPKVTQYGNNMVMTNVYQNCKHRYINIDTRFRDDYATTTLANFTFTFPERITNVNSIHVCSIEIPNTIYNISKAIGNNTFSVIKSNVTYPVTIPDGIYTTASLKTAINNAISTISAISSYIQYDNSYNAVNISSFTTTTSNMSLLFYTDISGNFNKYNIRSRLGWLLGYRAPSYALPTAKTLRSESLIDINGPRYLYLVVDEFNKSQQNSFHALLHSSLINKNILARIAIDTKAYPFGSIMQANDRNGLLISDDRIYTGKTDIQRCNIQLIDEYGNIVDLNGGEFSFCMKINYEQ